MAVLPPMPSASEPIAIAVKARACPRLRTPKRKSANTPIAAVDYCTVGQASACQNLREQFRHGRRIPAQGELCVGVLLQDLRYSLRTFRKSPGFALVAVLALAFGIGVNSAIFTLLDAIALRPLPVQNPSEVVPRDITQAGGREARSSSRHHDVNALHRVQFIGPVQRAEHPGRQLIAARSARGVTAAHDRRLWHGLAARTCSRGRAARAGSPRSPPGRHHAAPPPTLRPS